MVAQQSQFKKFKDAEMRLSHALSFKSKVPTDNFYYDGISKAFEVALEYAWKYLKTRVENEGLEVISPKDALRKAGELGIISDVEAWISFINARNIAVHDYLGIPNDDYIEIAERFLKISSLVSD